MKKILFLCESNPSPGSKPILYLLVADRPIRVPIDRLISIIELDNNALDPPFVSNEGAGGSIVKNLITNEDGLYKLMLHLKLNFKSLGYRKFITEFENE